MLSIDPTFLIILCVFGSGLCLGWVIRAMSEIKPPAEDLPHVTVKRTSFGQRNYGIPPKPVAPIAPIWDEDAFFANPERDHHPSDIERKSFAPAGSPSFSHH